MGQPGLHGKELVSAPTLGAETAAGATGRGLLKVNAQRFEAAIYANPDLRKVQVPQENKTTMDAQNLLAQLQANPELLSALSGLLNAAPN